MKYGQQAVALVLVLIMLISACPVTAFAVEEDLQEEVLQEDDQQEEVLQEEDLQEEDLQEEDQLEEVQEEPAEPEGDTDIPDLLEWTEDTAPAETGREAPAAENTASEEAPVLELTADAALMDSVSHADADPQENQELFRQYVDQVLTPTAPGSGRRMAKKSVSNWLTGNDLLVYTALKAKIAKVASGELASTTLGITPEELGLDPQGWTAEDLGIPSITTEDSNGKTIMSPDVSEALDQLLAFNLTRVLDALLADCPYELYWYNKTAFTKSFRNGFRASNDNEEHVMKAFFPENAITVKFPVAQAFSGAEEFTADTDLCAAAGNVKTTAQGIVSTYAAASDYDKLVNYRREICNRTSYNDEAGPNEENPYGNPWQLLWVFDHDTTTNVKCEGYAKAFQYLCDLTDFKNDITCYTVTGTTSENHMWNVVKMDDGSRYLVDVTNCDDGMIGANDQLFLAGYASGDAENGYTILCRSGSLKYTYDQRTRDLYGLETLTLSAASYDPAHTVHTLTKVEAKDPTCTEEGNTAYWTCSKCHQLFSDAEGENETTADAVKRSAAGHSLTKTEAKDPTCTEGGNTAYWTCSVCHKLFSDAEGENETTANAVKRSAGHTLTKTEAKDPTCTEDGNTAYWTCSVCHKLFSDAEGERETTADAVMRSAAGHTLTKTEAKDPTCTEEGNTAYWTCSKCHQLFSDAEGENETTADAVKRSAAGHSLTKTEAKDPTCTEGGNTAYWTCTSCSRVFADADAAQEISLDNTVISATGHSYTSEVTAPTPVAQGCTTHTCTVCGHSYVDTPVLLNAPVMSSASCVYGGVQVKWNPVKGAVRYRVFRRIGSGSWTALGDVSAASYTDKTAKSGTKYSYTVCCVTKDGKTKTSAYHPTGKTVTYIAAPALKSVTNVYGGVQITWSKSAGAAKYRVFYRIGSGSWKKLTDTTATSYKWTGAKSGTKYSFTVRCASGNGKTFTFTSAYNTTGKSVTYIAAPKLTKIQNTKSGVQITWAKSQGAAKYRVFRKTGKGSWVKVGDTTRLSFVDQKAKKGTTYAYSVRCISRDGKSYTSSYSTKGLSIKRK